MQLYFSKNQFSLISSTSLAMWSLTTGRRVRCLTQSLLFNRVRYLIPPIHTYYKNHNRESQELLLRPFKLKSFWLLAIWSVRWMALCKVGNKKGGGETTGLLTGELDTRSSIDTQHRFTVVYRPRWSSVRIKLTLVGGQASTYIVYPIYPRRPDQCSSQYLRLTPLHETSLLLTEFLIAFNKVRRPYSEMGAYHRCLLRHPQNKQQAPHHLEHKAHRFRDLGYCQVVIILACGSSIPVLVKL